MFPLRSSWRWWLVVPHSVTSRIWDREMLKIMCGIFFISGNRDGKRNKKWRTINVQQQKSTWVMNRTHAAEINYKLRQTCDARQSIAMHAHGKSSVVRIWSLISGLAEHVFGRNKLPNNVSFDLSGVLKIIVIFCLKTHRRSNSTLLLMSFLVFVFIRMALGLLTYVFDRNRPCRFRSMSVRHYAKFNKWYSRFDSCIYLYRFVSAHLTGRCREFTKNYANRCGKNGQSKSWK